MLRDHYCGGERSSDSDQTHTWSEAGICNTALQYPPFCEYLKC